MAIVNVRDFGALGDGVTDDTQAFLDALDILLNTFEMGTLYCPAGTYILSQQLEITKPFVGIRGDGIQVSLLQFTGSGLKLWGSEGGAFATIENILLNGPGISLTEGYSTVGITLPESNLYLLNSFQIANFDIGIDATTSVFSKSYNFAINDCKIGARFTVGCNASSMVNGRVAGCSEVGIEVNYAMSFFLSMLDIEAIGTPTSDPRIYLGGVSIKAAAYINIRDCHFETSDTVLGLMAGNNEVLFESSFIQYCKNGIKQLDPVIVGRFDFVDLKFLSVETEFDIPNLTKYRIKDCSSRDGAGGWDTELVIIADPVKGTVQNDVLNPEFGRTIAYRSGGLSINGRDVLTASKFVESITVGVIPAGSTVQFSVNTLTSAGFTVSEWGDVVQAVVTSYTMPPGLLLSTSIQQHTNDIILVYLTNTTGADINMGTQNFRFNVVSSYSGGQ